MRLRSKADYQYRYQRDAHDKAVRIIDIGRCLESNHVGYYLRYLNEAGRLFLAVRDLPEVDMSGGIGAEPSSPGSDPESINTP